MGIRKRLAACLLAALASTGALCLLTTQALKQQWVDVTERALMNTHSLEMTRINEILARQAKGARTLASTPGLAHYIDRAKANDFHKIDTSTGIFSLALKNSTNKNPNKPLPLNFQLNPLADNLLVAAKNTGLAVTSVQLIDRHGKALSQTTQASDTQHTKAIALRSMRSVTTLYIDAFLSSNNKPRHAIISPITTSNGETVGALLVEFELSSITNFISNYEALGESSEAYLVQNLAEHKTQFISALRYDKKAAFKIKTNPPTETPAQLALKTTNAKITQAHDYRGVQSLAVVQSIPNTHWGLVIKMDIAEAHAPIETLTRILVGAALLSTLILLLGYTLCLAPIARRLKRTEHTATKIMRGDLTARTLDRNTDEIGKLARTIDTLAHELQEDQISRSKTEANLLHHASHDELTGLLNRKHANEIIKTLNDDNYGPHSVVFLDLNGFKDINDLFGHAAGDAVLIAVAQRLSQAVSIKGTLSRWGGDEFVIILANTDDKASCEFAKKLHRAFENPIHSQHGSHCITSSIGTASSNGNMSLLDALEKADLKMYEEKKRQKLYRNKKAISSGSTRLVTDALLVNTANERLLEASKNEETAKNFITL